MAETVYICCASTGEYSDRTEFQLHGYRTEQEAQDFVTRSDQLFRERWAKVKGDYDERYLQFTAGWHPECPDLDVPDYTGYRFWYEAVEIKP